MIMNVLLASFANLVKCMNRRTQGNKLLMYPLDISTFSSEFLSTWALSHRIGFVEQLIIE